MAEDLIEEIIEFWFEEIDSSKWFLQDDTFDQELEQRFGESLIRAKRGEMDAWAGTARGCLALIVLLDQFSRNIHRDRAEAFAADEKARGLALTGIRQSLDLELSLEQRSFFYLPLRHAEDLETQRLGLRKTRELNAAGYGSDKYALSHLAVVERFGRFPHRNAALGRTNTPDEDAFLAEENAKSS